MDKGKAFGILLVVVGGIAIIGFVIFAITNKKTAAAPGTPDPNVVHPDQGTFLDYTYVTAPDPYFYDGGIGG